MMAALIVIIATTCGINVYAEEEKGDCKTYHELLETKEMTGQWYDEFIYMCSTLPVECRPKMMCNYFNEQELDLIYRVVMAEIGSDYYSFEQKANVADVIFYRWRYANCPDISTILTASQFSTVASGKIWKVTPTEEVKNACQYAFWFGGRFSGAYFFNNVKTWDGYYPYLGTDGAHYFYGR